MRAERNGQDAINIVNFLEDAAFDARWRVSGNRQSFDGTLVCAPNRLVDSRAAHHLIEGPSPEKELEDKEAAEVVNEMLETLTPREARVLRMRFGIGCNEHTLEEAGQVLDVTKERIRQIEAKAMRKMKHPSRFEELWSLRQ